MRERQTGLRPKKIATSATFVALALLAACTSKSTSGSPGVAASAVIGSPEATSPAAAASSNAASASTGTSPAPASPSSAGSSVASSSADGRGDPGAFASNLTWTDITKQLGAAVGDTNHKFLYAKATMQVPLNWADVTGKKISITVVRIRAVNQKNRIGSLLINPGGPGESGIDYAIPAALEEIPDAILDRFDIIGFDPRGIGLSSPIQCITDKQKDAELNLPADPMTDAQWQASIADVTQVAQECYTEYGSDLTYYSTAETARDVEALRVKLGDSKLTFLGYSYGTLLGAEYATAYPSKVRAMVLDGAVDPTISPIDQDKTQSAGFQLAFSHFAANCTAKGKSCPLGSNPQQFVLDLMAKAAAHPIASGDAKDKRTADDGAVLLGVISALYDETEWPDLVSALTDANKGDASGILSLDDSYNERSADGTYTNVEDANAAIGCSDATTRPTIAQARALQPAWRASNPIFGGSAASSLGFCSLWKAPPDQPITVANTGAAPILVIGTTGDPATPISGAQHLAALLGSGRLLVWQGDGHTAYPKTQCVTNDVDNYLINLTLPAVGATCPAT